jgi:subtilisin family serine protease
VEAWDTTTGDSDIVIAVLDNGVPIDHPDLNIFVNSDEIAGNELDDDDNGFVDDVNGWDFAGDNLLTEPGTNPDNDPNPTTEHDNHGTAVGGIAAAEGNNNLGVAGATQNARILPIKIARDDTGEGGGFVDPKIIAEAVYYAAGAVLDANNMIVDHWRGADILVNSLGGGGAHPLLSAAFNWATTDGRDGRGATSFNASGNLADGTVPQLKYEVIQVPVTPGQKRYVWSYQTNGDAILLGENRAWIANIVLPDGTQELLGNDNNLVGWTSTGWTIADDPVHAHGTARFVATAGVLNMPNQQTNLNSPVINVLAQGTLSFARYVSSQLQFDQFMNPISDSLVLFESTNGGMFVPVWGDAGNPFPERPVAYPASLASTIAVGASTDWDYRSAYSQFGAALDLVGPSAGGFEGVPSTDRTGADGYAAGDYVFGLIGTSFSTPLAAGIAALALSRNPELTTADIRAILRNTADRIGGDNGLTAYDANGFNQFYGNGRVNAETAVEAVPGASGDYNRNGSVDTADYVIWRKNLGSSVATAYAVADGSGNRNVGAEDHAVWRSHYDQTITPPGPGSGSGSAAESPFATTSQQSRLSTIAPAVNVILVTENAAIDAVGVEQIDVSGFPVIAAPIVRSVLSISTLHQARRALVDASVRQDAGLLAWLSNHLLPQSDRNAGIGDDSRFIATIGQESARDAADSIFKSLDVFPASNSPA